MRNSLEKLQLNDASLVWEPETSAALGFGFRCGFLGMLHMDIIQERLDREFNMSVITTVPSVEFNCYKTNGELDSIYAPSEMPEPNEISKIEEPVISAQIITKSDFIGGIIKLCIDRRGHYKIRFIYQKIELNYHLFYLFPR